MPYDSRQTVVAVTCHGKKPLALGILNDKGRPVVFHCRKEVWTEIPCMPTFFHDMCVFKKRFCAVNKIGRTFAFGPPPDYSEQLVAEYIDDGGGEMKFLVESEEGDELFLVDIYDRHCFGFPAAGEEDGLRLNVFRLDEKEKRWVKVTNLGDRVLFLGNRCSFSASIPKGGNCVIFIDEAFLSFDKMHCGMCVFQLDNGRLSPLSDYPHYINLFWPPPDWIVKLCSTPKLDLDHQM
ncbi:F-box protein [Trifolium pratense]|uniref:F-box protein n=1 Tax=Trifolium pratense TaxID=57577 RepID=A0A2K3LYH7_TRIPR|nr:F-box protein [Trifolium pratense]